MTKKEQKLFIQEVSGELKKGGITLGWFLKEVEISRTHWFFLKKGERPLTDAKNKAISDVIRKKCYSDND